ncbi:DNA polymerase III delta subunit [Bacillus sp. TS-2]|nr:DNA polymerase III delta subunit [Bacillus sp. TS-2]
MQQLISYVQTKEQQPNILNFPLSETPIEVIVEEAETMSFFGGNKIIVIKDFYAVSSKKIDSKFEHDFKQLERYLENPAPETILVILAPYEKLDERKKLTKLLKKTTVVEANTFDEKTLKEWLVAEAKTRNVTLEMNVAEQMMERVGTNLLLLTQEIDKLALYAGEGEEITEDMVKILVSRTLEQDIFALIDLAITNQTEKALIIFHDLLRQKEEPLKILSLLTRQIRIYYQVKELLKRGYSHKEMAQLVKLHPYVVKLASQKVHLFEEAQLKQLIKEAAECDYSIKTGKIEKALAVELYILKLAH